MCACILYFVCFDPGGGGEWGASCPGGKINWDTGGEARTAYILRYLIATTINAQLKSELFGLTQCDFKHSEPEKKSEQSNKIFAGLDYLMENILAF